MEVFYVDCFEPNEKATHGAAATLQGWVEASPATRALVLRDAATPDQLRERTEEYVTNATLGSVLVVGAHGHPSLEGFWVENKPVRWHDLSFHLRGRMLGDATFIFYSCDGGYPGMSHVFGWESGPDLVFGPRVTVAVASMRYALGEILNWKEAGPCSVATAITLVNQLHDWARAQYPKNPDQHEFLRVMWNEMAAGRHPATPGPDVPDGSHITLRCWGGLA